ARRIRVAARDAGLRPPAWLGTETVARLLGLRANHPFGQDALERGVNDPASRAETAYSLARLVDLDPSTTGRIAERAGSFSLPSLDDAQRAVLTRALQFVGTPYVWAGVSERPQPQWTADGATQLTVPGGFDCSGFVWRVYKLRPLPGAPAALATTLRGRTSYAMSGEVPVDRRVGAAALAPGDVVFFGDRGPRSKPRQVGHMGIYVGNGWIVHSSRAGTTLQPLEGWYADTLAWGRRPLAEAAAIVS
ncbi:MAG: NlpC/P60 family protein, partial [Actinobacteria bacterium]|nr:NlpC/P60 family protein [Actinomycetota bacterium]